MTDVPPLPPTMDQAKAVREENVIEAEVYEPLSEPVNIFKVAEVLLKQPGRLGQEIQQGNAWRILCSLLGISLFSYLIFGLIVGMFSWGAQLWIAPLKISVGVLFSGLICFPSLFIFSCLSGISVTLRTCFILLAGLLAVAGLLLIGFAPVSWVFSQSTEGVGFMGFINLLFWLIAVLSGRRFLMQAIQARPRQGAGYLGLWVVIFLLVSLQMTTTLRPILGQSDSIITTEKKFFMAHWGDMLSGQDDKDKAAR